MTPDRPSPDLRPILVCRIEVPAEMIEDVDGWMPKHFDDSLDHEAVVGAVSYAVERDFHPTEGLPWVFNGHGNRFIVYVAESMAGLLDWIDSPFLREAIEDGQAREGRYPALDGERFIGNVYEGVAVHMPQGRDLIERSAMLVERFHVGPALDAAFSEWLETRHAMRWAQVPDVIRVRTYRQVEDLPKRWPFTRYSSKGNRMVLVEYPLEIGATAFARRPEVTGVLAESLQWDLRLPYVRREVGRSISQRDTADAAATLESRRAEG